MSNLRNLVALGAIMAFVAFAQTVHAQDDLDDLLSDLEGGETQSSEETAAQEEKEPSEEAAAETPAKEEPAAEEPAAEEASEEAAAETPAEKPAAEEASEEAAAETPAKEEPAAEEPAEETAAETPAEEPKPEKKEAVAVKSDEEASLLDQLAAEDVGDQSATKQSAEEPAAEDAAAVKPEAVPGDSTPSTAKEAVVQAKPRRAKVPDADQELLENIRATENIRRKAFDLQARRNIELARKAMETEEFKDAIRYYQIAQKLLNDKSSMSDFRRECEQGVAEGYYRSAMQEDSTGRRDRAIKLMKKALDHRYPKARRQLESWLREDDPELRKTDLTEITNRRNDAEYLENRAKINRHLKRSHQLYATHELDRALEECELAIVIDPYNREALRLRDQIQNKRRTIYQLERKAARDGMIADVDKAWRPVYAPNAQEIAETRGETTKRPIGDDPERALEQKIYQRMKEMRLPSISFKPPATIIDAVDFFRSASKDYDRPDLPLEQRGFNFMLKTPDTLRAATASTASSEEEDGSFGSEDESADESASAQPGVPMIPIITASDISFYDALKLVCESVNYKFKVQDSIVLVMEKGMTTEEMVTRSYPVVAAFMDRMDSASSDMKTMRSGGFGGGSDSSDSEEGDGNQQRDWKEFFKLLGVEWPDGSSIMYIKTIGKLRVKNTYENLAELEKALTEMNADPKLIEIETRFVEVCQEDLNSLGFEWILNSDYTLGLGSHVSRALGLRGGTWGSASGSTTTTSDSSTGTGSSSTSTGGVINNNGGVTTSTSASSLTSSTSTKTTYANSNGASWIRNGSASHGRVGVNGIGGDAAYGTNMRYLSTLSNHISGESNSHNDQFMRINAFLGGADLSMILHMLSQRSDTDLLSAPKVLTQSGQEAVMKVVTEYIYPTDYDVQLQSSSSSSGGNNSGGSQSAILAVVEPQEFTMREVGVILTVNPQLTDDGNLIDLELDTQVVDEPTWKNYGMKIPFTGNSSLTSFQGIGEIFTGLSQIIGSIGGTIDTALKNMIVTEASDAAVQAMKNLSSSGDQNMTYYDAPMEQPFFHTRQIHSKISVYPGATIVMGGLITEHRKAMDDKIPFLGDLPFIGRLFRSHSEQTTKRNLLIFVTTRLVDVRGREVAMAAMESKEETVQPAPEESK